LQSWDGSVPKTILVTSSQPGDGKTTTTVNTAISLAQLGRSVLIIDCDLRTPKVHTLLGVDQVPGLTSCLNTGLDVDDAIQQMHIPNLALLPAGPVPPNPAELISSNRMKDILSLLGRRYDHILIDSPPLINLADALILSSSVEGVILVVYSGRTTCDEALRARDELSNAGANILGVVVNHFNSRRERYNYY
jgi:capsular exopolysaccharide synthesis family protein